MDRANGYQRVVVQNVERHKQLAEFFAKKWGEGEWPAVMFTREKAHARAQARELSIAIGLKVEVVTSDMPKLHREGLAARMRQRDPAIPVVVATDVWATGIDISCLRAEYNLGGGSAPIGLRQRAGRPLRRCGGKECKIYDVVDRTSEGAFEEHNVKRLKHYERAGFKVSDRELMAQLLEGGGKQPAARQRQGESGLRGPEFTPGTLDYVLMFLTDPFCLILTLVGLFFIITSYCD